MLVEALLQVAQNLQRLEGRHLVEVQLSELGGDSVLYFREQSELPFGAVRRRTGPHRETRSPFEVELSLFEIRENLLSSGDERGRKACKTGDLDAVTPIGTATDHLAEKHDIVFPLTRRYVVVRYGRGARPLNRVSSW